MSKPTPIEALAILDEVVGALAHPARRQILLAVHFRGEMAAGDIAKRFAHAWATTSRHIAILEKAGLLAHDKRGRSRVYRVDQSKLDVLRDWLKWFEPPAAED